MNNIPSLRSGEVRFLRRFLLLLSRGVENNETMNYGSKFDFKGLSSGLFNLSAGNKNCIHIFMCKPDYVKFHYSYCKSTILVSR